MDEDGSGSISSNEVASMLMGFGCDVSPKVVQAVMRTSDVNGDGEINFEEFLCAVTSKIKDGTTSEHTTTTNKWTPEVRVIADTEDQKNLPICPWEEEEIPTTESEQQPCTEALTCQKHRPCKELAEKYEQKMREEYRQAINSAPTSPDPERKATQADDELNNNKGDDSNQPTEDVWQQNEELDNTIRSAAIFNSIQMLDFSDFVQVVQTV